MMRQMKALFLALFVSGLVHAQTPNIENYLSMLESGEGDKVRGELPQLLSQYPNNPGVLYLQAVLTTDGAEAVRMYQNIVDSYPQSEWADDALFKVYKFYYAIGLFRTAEIKLNQLKSSYPESKHLTGLAFTDTKPEQEKTESAPPIVRQPDPPAPKKEEPLPATVPSGTETARREEVKVTQTPPVVPQKKFALQVGAFSTRANANAQKSFFEFHKYQADIGTKARGSIELYIVYVGNFATEEEARSKGNEIKREFNMDYIVVTR